MRRTKRSTSATISWRAPGRVLETSPRVPHWHRSRGQSRRRSRDGTLQSNTALPLLSFQTPKSTTYRTVRTARVVMFLVDGRVQRGGEMHRGEVWQRARIVAYRNLHDRVVMCTGVDAKKRKRRLIRNLRLLKNLNHPSRLWKKSNLHSWLTAYRKTHLIPGSRPQDDLGR